MLPYISPTCGITVGAWRVNRLKRFDVFSSRINPSDLGEIETERASFPLGSVLKGDKVLIHQGYRESGIWLIFGGTVDDVVPDSKTVVITCQDGMKPLKGTNLTQVFTSVLPGEVFTFGLGRAGITSFRLSTQTVNCVPRFVCAGEPATAAFKRVNRTWGLEDWAFYFEPEGGFWWGPWEESDRYTQQTEIPVLEYGQNILEHEPRDSNQKGVLETIALPFLRHSHRIKIRDRRFFSSEQVARIDRVHYHHGEKKARLRIEWSLPPKTS